jgi:hypothetical protein
LINSARTVLLPHPLAVSINDLHFRLIKSPIFSKTIPQFCEKFSVSIKGK